MLRPHVPSNPLRTPEPVQRPCGCAAVCCCMLLLGRRPSASPSAAVQHWPATQQAQAAAAGSQLSSCWPAKSSRCSVAASKLNRQLQPNTLCLSSWLPAFMPFDVHHVQLHVQPTPPVPAAAVPGPAAPAPQHQQAAHPPAGTQRHNTYPAAAETWCMEGPSTPNQPWALLYFALLCCVVLCFAQHRRQLQLAQPTSVRCGRLQPSFAAVSSPAAEGAPCAATQPTNPQYCQPVAPLTRLPPCGNCSGSPPASADVAAAHLAALHRRRHAN